MAQVITLNGPSVAAQNTPVPEQNINPTPNAFLGTAIGEGMKDLAQATGKSSDEMFQVAQKYQDINNKTAADQASVGATAAMDQMALDYQKNNMGLAANQNYGQFQTDLEAKRQEFGAGLTPMAKLEFESATRRYAANTLSSTKSFAFSQWKEATVKTFEAVVNQNIALGIADPTKTDEAAAAIGKQVAALADPHVLGWTPEQATEYAREKLGSMFTGQIRSAMASGNLADAQRIFDEHKGSMSAAQLLQSQEALKTATHANTIASAADAIVDGAATTNVVALRNAVRTQESHGQAGVVNASTGAAGIMQTMPATAKEMTQKLGLPWQPELLTAKTPEAAAYQQKLGDAYLDQAITAYPNDPRKQLEYYYGGPDQKQWGPKTQAYADAVLKRLGGQAQTSYGAIPFSKDQTADEYLANADLTAMQRSKEMFPDDPVAQQQTYQAAMQRINARARLIGVQQKNVFDGIQDWMIANQVSDPNAVQKNFPNEWNALPAAMKMRLQSEATGQGNVQTIPRQQNFSSLMGLSGSNPDKFADPAQTNLAAMDLTINDRKRLEGLQASLQRNADAKKQRTAQLNTYLSDPIVANIVRQTWPNLTPQQKADDKDYNTFVGQLEGLIEAGNTTGQPATREQIRTAAQTLVTEHKTGGIWGFFQSTSHNYDVPDNAKSAITSAWQNKYGRQPSEEEVAQMYRLNGGSNRKY
jgi:hypothetical protein